MKVFISWSGRRSKHIASMLRELLPQVIQAVQPFMSDDDIEAGDRWPNGLGNELDSTHFGILCLTPENTTAPWLLYEAGALSKSLDKSRVCPLLFDLTFDDVKWPLAQFQSNTLNRAGLESIISSINTSLGDKKLEANRLEKIFNRVWPDFEVSIANVPEVTDGKKTIERTDRDVLNEILHLLRSDIRNSYFNVPADVEEAIGIKKICDHLVYMRAILENKETDQWERSVSSLMLLLRERSFDLIRFLNSTAREKIYELSRKYPDADLFDRNRADKFLREYESLFPKALL